MSTVPYAVSDTLVLAKRSLFRIRRQPDLLVGYTIQPIMFVLLFVYVFGGAIATPGFEDYTDFLLPGIIVQSMVFGGFVTALGLSEDVKKGLIDRFRSLPMWTPAVVTGRILADVGTNAIQLAILLGVGFVIGFRFSSSAPEVLAGILLLFLIGYAFSWVFAFLGLTASSPEAANAYGFTILFPLTFISSAFVPTETMPDWLRAVRGAQPVHDHGRRGARALPRHACGERHLAVRGLVHRHHRGLRAALRVAVPAHGHALSSRLRSGLLGLAIGLALADSSIVTLALPDVLRDFDVGVTTVAWVLTSFNLVLALVALPGGLRRAPDASSCVRRRDRGLRRGVAGLRAGACVRRARRGALRPGRRRGAPRHRRARAPARDRRGASHARSGPGSRRACSGPRSALRPAASSRSSWAGSRSSSPRFPSRSCRCSRCAESPPRRAA